MKVSSVLMQSHSLKHFGSHTMLCKKNVLMLFHATIEFLYKAEIDVHDAKIHCCVLAQLPVRDENISRSCLPSFMSQAASGFELCTHACMHTDKTQKVCLGLIGMQA